jgi:hypothetical protein
MGWIEDVCSIITDTGGVDYCRYWRSRSVVLPKARGLSWPLPKARGLSRVFAMVHHRDCPPPPWERKRGKGSLSEDSLNCVEFQVPTQRFFSFFCCLSFLSSLFIVTSVSLVQNTSCNPIVANYACPCPLAAVFGAQYHIYDVDADVVSFSLCTEFENDGDVRNLCNSFHV